MKTLREHLLERSREAASESELAAMRERVARRAGGEAATRDACAPGWALALARTLWRELVWPCRVGWAIIAAGWVAVMIFGLEVRVEASRASLIGPRELALLAMMARERQFLSELDAIMNRDPSGQGAKQSPVGDRPLSRVFLDRPWRPV